MKSWISAARLRTLPLALSSIFMGSFLAIDSDRFDWLIFLLASLTTVFLQVLSNFANDYGDTQNGADISERVGPIRAVQSGEIPAKKMFKAIVLFAMLSFLLGLSLLFTAFKDASAISFVSFLLIGICCILAAYTYTAGKNPYGYAGLGDISVFLFFGLIGVLGSNFLFTQTFEISNLLPAVSCGLLATGVLNLNNIRDIDSDKKTGKFTIPVRLGRKKSIFYHWFLLLLAMFCLIIFSLQKDSMSWWFLLAYPLLFINGIKTSNILNPDPLLKQLALTTLLLVLLFGISLIF